MSTAVSGHIANIRRVIDAGARDLLIPRLWPGELAPGFPAIPNLNEAGLEIDQALDDEIEQLKQSYAINVFRPDMFEFFQKVWASPQTYGFTDLSGSAQSSPAEDNDFFWWDGLHFTRAAHYVVGEEIYRHLTPPTQLEPPRIRKDGMVELRWTGGQEPFLLQQPFALGVGLWETIGTLTDEREATAPASENSNRQAFFRIVPLGQ